MSAHEEEDPTAVLYHEVPRIPGQEKRKGLLIVEAKMTHSDGRVAIVHTWGETTDLAGARAGRHLAEHEDGHAITYRQRGNQRVHDAADAAARLWRLTGGRIVERT